MSKLERAGDNHGILTLTHTTLRMSVPASFKRRFGLSGGDHVVWYDAGNGTAILKFVKREQVEELAEAGIPALAG
jgi:hypothetical protein